MARVKTKSLTPKKWFLLLVVLIAGFLIYNYLSIQANKKTFAQARLAINNIFSQTTKNLGPPDASRRIDSCGDSDCTIYTSFIYAVTDKSQAESYLHTIQSDIKSQDNFVPAKSLSTHITTSSLGYHSTQDVYNFKSLSCTAKYLYDTPQATLLKMKNNSKKPFYVEIGCTGSAKHKYYSPAQR